MSEYISKQFVIDYLNSYLNSIAKCGADSLLFDRGQRRALINSIQDISAAKASDVQLVKHGRWSECYTDSHHYSGICSVCGRASIKSLTESLYKYCPKCGARMDGDPECQ